MPNVRYYAKDDSALESVIMLDFPYNNRRLRVSTGLVMTRDLFKKIWSAKKKNLNSNYLHLSEYKHLNRLKEFVEESYKQFRAQGSIPSPDVLKEQVKLSLNQLESSPKEKMASFIERYNQFIDYKGTINKPDSIKVYQRVLDDLIAFASTRKKALTFESIDMEFYDDYMRYLLTKPNTNANCKTEIGLLNDTIAKRISNLKMFMRWARERGYHQNSTFEKFEAKRAQKNEIVVLTESELDVIANLDLSHRLHLERTRDLFLFGAFTGQRWGDLAAYQADQVHDKDTDFPVWVFLAEKTKKVTRVPLIGYCTPALKVLKKYNFILPKIIEQNFNEYIKEVAKLAGIDQPVTLKRYSGKKLIEIKGPKYEFISSHCARRTFVTELLQRGVPATTIMKITNHSDLKTIMKYEATSDDAVIKALERSANR